MAEVVSVAPGPGQLPASNQVRNSMLVTGSSFIAAPWQIAREHVGLNSLLFSTGAGLLAAAEYSDTPS